MQMNRFRQALSLVILLFSCSAGTVIAEEPSPDPDPELQGDDPLNEEQPPAEEPTPGVAAEEAHEDGSRADDNKAVCLAAHRLCLS